MKTARITWEELLPFKNQLIVMEKELIVKYHYPNRDVLQEYLNGRFENLEGYMKSGSTYFGTVIENNTLVGYYWAYITQFLDTKRWNLRSLYISESFWGGKA